MPSPFPGMDPFIEINPRWESFHGWFVRKLAEQALPQAQALDCWIDVERTVYQRLPSGEVMIVGEPDDVVGAAYGTELRRSAGGVALLERKAVYEVVLDPDRLERIRQDYLVVRELGQFHPNYPRPRTSFLWCARRLRAAARKVIPYRCRIRCPWWACRWVRRVRICPWIWATHFARPTT